ncbi:hypothetical protein [Calidithermus chliarophilus]|uniref:hypothetical protein n=1 Tax=Calidithermus chliarophilus TaxID=52023 RepID=UPI0012F686A1|nr:hypothetical protein [Calidithermus chliarophilus]
MVDHGRGERREKCETYGQSYRGNMMYRLNGLLRQMADGLNRGSLNYTVSFALLAADGIAGTPIAEAVSAALGRPVRLGEILSVTPEDALVEVAQSLDYIGDYGSHPDLTFVGSLEFSQLRSAILDSLRELLLTADQVMRFSLQDGHPFYPVFWDYAFLIEKQEDTLILIGSSSD